MHCHRCGEETRGPRYCTFCGAPLEQAPPIPTEQFVPPQAREPARDQRVEPDAPVEAGVARVLRSRVFRDRRVWVAIGLVAVLLIAALIWRSCRRDVKLEMKPLLPEFYAGLEDSIAIRPVRGASSSGDDGPFYVLQFASAAQAVSAWEKIVSLAGAEKEIAQLEGSVDQAAWIVGERDSELFGLDEDLIIVARMGTTDPAEAKRMAGDILKGATSRAVKAALEDVSLLVPTRDLTPHAVRTPTATGRATSRPTRTPTLRQKTATPRSTAKLTVSEVVVHLPRCPDAQASLARIEVDTAKGEVRFEGSTAIPEAQFDYWKVEWWPAASGEESAKLVGGTVHRTRISKGRLLTWDASELPVGNYRVRLRVVQKDGNYQECLSTIRWPAKVVSRPTASRTPRPSPTGTRGAPTRTATPTVYMIHLPEVVKEH